MRIPSLPYDLLRSEAVPASASNDRGIVHQLLLWAGLSSADAHNVQVLSVGPLRILVIVVVALVLSHLVGRLARRTVQSLRLVSPLVRATPRGSDRARTLAGVFSSIFRGVIWVVAALAILDQLGIKLAPFVATATVIGAAVGFGAQSLVKDFLSGLLILAEDQYGVGDSIVVGNTTGTVEGLSLRTTRMRALDGVVWYVPNGEIRMVGNNTESDSCALVDVVVPLGTDLAVAGRAMQDEARLLAGEPAWRDVVIGDPTFIGVQATDHEGATLRLLASTRPGEHFRLGRELRLRLIDRLRNEKIAWASAADADTAAGKAHDRSAAPTKRASRTAPRRGG
ncbi:MAG: mechanosensitive ion channel family protein [Acidimicrobiales bacterium]